MKLLVEIKDIEMQVNKGEVTAVMIPKIDNRGMILIDKELMTDSESSNDKDYGMYLLRMFVYI